MYRINVYLLISIILLLVPTISCIASSEREVLQGLIMQEFVIVKEDAGKTFKAIQGNTILICLDENRSTGYQWEIDLSDDQVISLEKTDYTPGSKKTIGSGGTRTFHLKAESSGSVKILLRLKNEWKPDDSAIDKFEVTIKVEAE